MAMGIQSNCNSMLTTLGWAYEELFWFPSFMGIADFILAGEGDLSFFLSILSRSNFDHHLRCGGLLNFEFSLREKHSGWAIKTIYKKLCRGMLKHIPLYQ